MAKETAQRTTGADGFEPPKYLASLIAAINDGAKAAQAGMLLFLLVGLYLLATAFSASDEDILLGKAVTISQIGASLPVSFSFAIAPLVFVFLHVYALTRYDMLATNVRYFLGEMRATVPLESDRERCRQLLPNVEFVLTLTVPRGSSLRSRFWPFLTVATMAGFPVIVLLLVQINALRYQSDLINWVQRLWLLIEVLAIVAFFLRNPLNGRALGRESWFGFVTHWTALLALPPLLVWMNLAWLNVVPTEADAAVVRFDPQQWQKDNSGELPDWSREIGQPLDFVLCPRLQWGCRYLRVEHRTLVDHVWDDKAMAVLRSDDGDYAAAVAGIEGVVLRERNPRFVVLDDSRLYAADLVGADLHKASLVNARLLSARLILTDLQDANLAGAQLASANLGGAWLAGANLNGAQLADATLSEARLADADLFGAQLAGADLSYARLVAADLRFTRLAGADLTGAQLAGADLGGAQLAGATLRGAQLSGANLLGADLEGTYLQGARLWHADLDQATSLELADLRGADFRTPPDDIDRSNWIAVIGSISELNAKQEATERLARALSADAAPPAIDFSASAENPVLVSDAKAEVFESVPSEWLLPEPKIGRDHEWVPTLASLTYLNAQSDFLAVTLWRRDPAIARGIARRINNVLRRDTLDLPARLVACRLLDENMTTSNKQQQTAKEIMQHELRGTDVDCTTVDQWISKASVAPK